jgi:hypothetical protein
VDLAIDRTSTPPLYDGVEKQSNEELVIEKRLSRIEEAGMGKGQID